MCSFQEANVLVFDSLARKPTALVTSTPYEPLSHQREKFLQCNMCLFKKTEWMKCLISFKRTSGKALESLESILYYSMMVGITHNIYQLRGIYSKAMHSVSKTFCRIFPVIAKMLSTNLFFVNLSTSKQHANE